MEVRGADTMEDAELEGEGWHVQFVENTRLFPQSHGIFFTFVC